MPIEPADIADRVRAVLARYRPRVSGLYHLHKSDPEAAHEGYAALHAERAQAVAEAGGEQPAEPASCLPCWALGKD